MAVKYDKLFKELKKRNMKDIELTRAAGFSGNIMTRIRRDEYVSLESIEKICRVLKCKMDDIVTFTK
jgi:DNA-binding Xre family transcriptional regulator